MAIVPVQEKEILDAKVSPELLRILRRYAEFQGLEFSEVVEAGLIEFLLFRVKSIYRSDIYKEEFPILRAMRYPGISNLSN